MIAIAFYKENQRLLDGLTSIISQLEKQKAAIDAPLRH